MFRWFLGMLRFPDSGKDYRGQDRETVEGGEMYWLAPSDRYEQDCMNRYWQDTAGRPSAFIHDDLVNRANRSSRLPDLKLECFHPISQMSDDDDEPEIAAAIIHT